jgi:predicted nucleic acid-binding protein
MLIDARPLVSLCDRNQSTYPRCQLVLDAATAPLVSTWPCLTEAMYLVGRIGGLRLQQHLWGLINRGIVRLHDHTDGERAQMALLMDRYQNVPMDLADASLVAVANALGDRTIFTLDSDFRIYRLGDRSVFEMLPD